MHPPIAVIRDRGKHSVGNSQEFALPLFLTQVFRNFRTKVKKIQLNTKISRIVLCLFLASANIAYADKLDSSLSLQKESIHTSKSSQKKINKLADKAQDLATEYRATLHKISSLKIYNTQLDKVIGSQKKEISSLNQQLKDIDITQKEIVPLILKMLDMLNTFIQLDTPFLVTERSNRIQALREIMDRADITVSEKYRRVIEAYQIEIEYGRTIEAYESHLPASQTKRTVELLRVGRLGLFYLSLDGNEVGFWDKKSKNWVKLDNSFRRSVSDGIRIARKQAAPNLLLLPVNFVEQP